MSLPTEEAIKNLLKEVKSEKLTPYIDKVSDEPLMKEAPKGGKIVSEKKDDIFGTTMLTLSNGVKVIIKKTDFKADEIRMKGVSMGGSSLFPDSEIININGLDAVALGGLGNFSAIELEKAWQVKKLRKLWHRRQDRSRNRKLLSQGLRDNDAAHLSDFHCSETR